MHPGELMLMRIIGQGRWQHPFHFHGNHARVLARDGNLILSRRDGKSLAGPLLFTTPTVSGQIAGPDLHVDGQGAQLGRLQPQEGRRLDLHARRERLLHRRSGGAELR